MIYRIALKAFKHTITKFIGGALGGGYIYDIVSGLL